MTPPLLHPSVNDAAAQGGANKLTLPHAPNSLNMCWVMRNHGTP